MITGTISSIMTRDVITANVDDTVQDAAKIMKEHGIANVIVVSNGKPVGILTQRDVLLRVIAEGKDPKSVKVKDVMTKPLVTSKEDITILDAIRMMYDKKIRRLPIVDKDGKLIGIVTYRDVLGILLTRLIPFLVK